MKLRFDFQQQTRLFCNPIAIIETSDPTEVMAKLQQVEQAVNSGYYAAGYLAYEAASGLIPYLVTAKPGKLPLLWFGIFQAPQQVLPEETVMAEFPLCSWQPTTSYQHYQQAIQRIHAEIAAGNTYQVNYTIRLESEFQGQPEPFYHYLRSAQPTDYAAYLDLGRFHILSASPELFFHWQQGKITTRPMKGTMPRGLNQQHDQQQRELLAHSAKDQAENVMIVDLLRNDLSQIAKPGSVKVESLFEIEKYPTVWQMTSTISAQTRPQTSLVDLFQALFPCGSITGAPKASTMQLIAELESTPRDIYCGAIGFITPQQEALFNVAIRTVTIDTQQQSMSYGVGGGITWDSTAGSEYQEVIDKAKILHGVTMPVELLESLLLSQGNYTLLEEHLNRLADSADYFSFNCPLPAIRQQLLELTNVRPQGEWKIRLLLTQDGTIQLQHSPLETLIEPLTACWSPFAVNSRNRLLYHKTTQRSHYPQATLEQEFLLYNERDEITEFVNGNVALLIEGTWLTPPISCGLLPGTMRQSLLATGQLQEAIVAREQLTAAEKIAFMNSVRGWREVIWQK